MFCIFVCCLSRVLHGLEQLLHFEYLLVEFLEALLELVAVLRLGYGRRGDRRRERRVVGRRCRVVVSVAVCARRSRLAQLRQLRRLQSRDAQLVHLEHDASFFLLFVVHARLVLLERRSLCCCRC